jgi:hypothetical protein
MPASTVPWYVANPVSFAVFVAGLVARTSPVGSQTYHGGYALGDIQLATVIHELAHGFGDKSAVKAVQAAARSIISKQAAKISR